jgi:RNA polymerase sigma-70 factor, ECF subfamily
VTEPAALRLTSSVNADRRRRLESLYAEHAAVVFAFARRRTSWADADEAVSETFLVAWRRLDDVPDQPRAWLLGVARNVLANQRRAENRRNNLSLRVAEQPPPKTGELVDDVTDERVRRALACLSPAERDVITLLAWDELTPAEVAVVVGCSRAAVYLRLHRARRRLATLLAPPSASKEPDRDDD